MLELPFDMLEISFDMLEISFDMLELPFDMLEISFDMLELPFDMLEISLDMLELPSGISQLPSGILELPSGIFCISCVHFFYQSNSYHSIFQMLKDIVDSIEFISRIETIDLGNNLLDDSIRTRRATREDDIQRR